MPTGSTPKLPVIGAAEKFCVEGIAASTAVPSRFDPALKNGTLPDGMPPAACGGATVALSVTLPGSCRVALLVVSVTVGTGCWPLARRGNSSEAASCLILRLIIGGLLAQWPYSAAPAERRRVEPMHRHRKPKQFQNLPR